MKMIIKIIIKKIIDLRIERAKLLGYKTHADYVLEKTMAKTPENVYRLLKPVMESCSSGSKKRGLRTSGNDL